MAWEKISADFIQSNDLDESLELDNPWLDAETEKITGQVSDLKVATWQIYHFISDHFTCTSRNGFSARHTLKEIYKNRNGNEAEINLLLIALLRHIKVLAYPAVLSTRANGFADLERPLMQDFNYLICIVYEGDYEIKLDASWPNLPFGRLMPECYNGARIMVSNNPKLLILSTDSLNETKMTNVFIVNDEKGGFSGTVSTTFGVDQSYTIREEVRKKTAEEFFRKNVKYIETGVKHSNDAFDSLANYSIPLIMHNDIVLDSLLKSDLVYLTPVLGPSYITNPFVADERIYPVEFPYKRHFVYVLSMEIPKGYLVDEIPKSTRIRLNDNQGLFEYVIQQNSDNIQMQMRLKLNKTNFPVEDYASLRSFLGTLLKKSRNRSYLKKFIRQDKL